MGVTLTKIAGPCAVGPGQKVAIYTCAWDAAYATGGEALDLTGEFTSVDGILFGGNDTSADNTYAFNALLPASGTACTTSNTLMQVWNGGTTNAILEEEGTSSLAAIGDTKIVVFGV